MGVWMFKVLKGMMKAQCDRILDRSISLIGKLGHGGERYIPSGSRGRSRSKTL